MSRSDKFARILAAELRNSKVEQTHKHCYRVSGRLDIGAIYVNIQIEIPWLFRSVKRKPFKVWCHEEWIRPGADWHNMGKFGLCWALPIEWRDVMNWKGKQVSKIMREGREWFFKSLRMLINRHYLAYIDNLDNWKPEWDYHSHFKTGVTEYERARRLRQSQRSNRQTRIVDVRRAYCTS